jgi:hypothetical protein
VVAGQSLFQESRAANFIKALPRNRVVITPPLPNNRNSPDMAPSSRQQPALSHFQARLPTLLYSPHSNMRSGSPSQNTLKLPPSALKPWRSFSTLVSDTLLPLQQLPIITSSTLPHEPLANERMLVGNENGVRESFKRNIGDVLLPIQDLLAANDMDGRLYFADPEVGPATCWKSETVAKGITTMPNVAGVFTSPEIVRKTQQGDRDLDALAVVGEVKTPWTTTWLSYDFFGGRASGQANRDKKVLAQGIGQLVQYMDDAHLTYGFYTNYVATVFIRRRTEEEFLVSPPAFWNDSSDNSHPTVRMCFLALARWIRDPLNRSFPKQTGPKLVGSSTQGFSVC